MPRTISIRPVVLLLVAAGWSTAVPASAVTWTRAVGMGDPAPERPAGESFGRLELVSRLADDGSLAVVSRSVPEPPIAPDLLYRRSPDGEWELLATASHLGPVAEFRTVRMNERGDVLLWGQRPFAPLPCGDDGVSFEPEFLALFEADGAVRLVAESFGAAPGFPGGGLLYDGFWDCFPGSSPCFYGGGPPLLSAAGAAGFFASASSDPCTEPTRAGVYGPDGTGAETLAALEGEPAPGAAGARFEHFSWFEQAPDASGRFPFFAWLDDARVALYRWQPGIGAELLILIGEPAPLVGGASFQFVGPPALDAAGTPAFFASEQGPVPEGQGPLDAYELWGPDGSGGVTRLAGRGLPAPGAPEGAVFAPQALPRTLPPPSLGTPGLNAAGEVAAALPVELAGGEIVGAVFGPDAGGGFTLRLLAGGPAPGIPGARFVDFEVAALDDEREILLWTVVTGEAIDETNEQAWYRFDPSGELHLLVREGQLFEVAPGELEPLDAFPGHTLALARAPGLEHFALAVSPTTLGRNALFVTAVPEPCASLAGVGALAALGLLASRRSARRPIRTACRTRSFRVS